MNALHLDEIVISSFCQRHHIRRLSLFGSRSRGEERAGSDVDLLVEFEQGHVPGFAFVSIADEMSAILGIKADLRTPAEISPRFRDQVFTEATLLYES